MDKDKKAEKAFAELVRQFELFLEQSRKTRMMHIREWIGTPLIKVYVRAGMRYFGKKFGMCIDLASFEIQEEFQRRGLATRFIKKVEEISPYPYLFIENVMYREWAESLMREGWQIQESGSVPEMNVWCLYKRKCEQQECSK